MGNARAADGEEVDAESRKTRVVEVRLGVIGWDGQADDPASPPPFAHELGPGLVSLGSALFPLSLRSDRLSRLADFRYRIDRTKDAHQDALSSRWSRSKSVV